MDVTANGSTSIYRLLADVPKALANERRLELIDLLAQGEKSVETLAEQAGLGVANASQHLHVLRRAGLAESRRDGRRVYYRVAGDDVLRLVQSVRSVGEARVAALERTLRERRYDELEPLRLDVLRDRLKDGRTVILDVRPEEEYRAGHLPGARSIPLDELEERLAELPDNAPVVAYCRGPYCRMSERAVELLKRAGRRAERLEGGPPEWRTAGYAVERSVTGG